MNNKLSTKQKSAVTSTHDAGKSHDHERGSRMNSITAKQRRSHAPAFWEALADKGLDRSDVQRHLGRSRTYIADRMTGRKTWTLAEAYALCELVDRPKHHTLLFWPPSEVQ